MRALGAVLFGLAIVSSCSGSPDPASTPVGEQRTQGEFAVVEQQVEDPLEGATTSTLDLGDLAGPDTDCDGVVDQADARPFEPNDIQHFQWGEVDHYGYARPSSLDWPLVEYWWDAGGVQDRCDLNGNGVVDSFEPDPEAIEADVLAFIADIRAEQVEWDIAAFQASELDAQIEAEAREVEAQLRAEEERAHQKKVDQQELLCQQSVQRIDEAVEALNNEIDAADREAEAAGWTDEASERYWERVDGAHQQLDAVQKEHNDLMDTLDAIYGC